MLRGKSGGAASAVVVVLSLVGVLAARDRSAHAATADPGEVAIPDFAVAVAPDAGSKGEQGTGEIDLGAVIQSAVYSVSKRPQLVRESPGIASVITQDQAHRYGWNSLNDVLYRQPGFAPSRDYERRVVAARGQFESWNNNHLLLLVDGVPFNDNLYGTAYTWEITPLDLASAVEVVRGPASALYGGNATNGVINVRTPTIGPSERVTRGKVELGIDGTQRYRALAGQGARVGSVIVSYDRFTTPGDEYASFDGSARADMGGALRAFQVQDERADQYLFTKISGNAIAPGLSLQLHYQTWNFETGHGWLWEIPDANSEHMHEARALGSLSYHRSSKAIEQEYVVRFQRHDIEWNNRYFSPGNSFYPDGAFEQLTTHTQDVFARGQAGVDLPKEMNLYGGAEYTGFFYGGDASHTSNVDLTTFAPNPGNETTAAGPFLERILDHPVHNIGGFLQLTSGKLLGRRATITAGARYDRNFFKYVDITMPDRPTVDKAFQQLSPRVALVLFPTDQLSVKLLAGKGFRAPAPSELFGANTFALGSNIDQLQPETIQTLEAAFDWAVVGNWIWRGNVFHRVFNDQIAYSVSNFNLSTNVYSNTTAGAETELLADFPVGEAGRMQGFLNYSLVQLLEEKIADPTIATSDRLTWAPEHVGNLGVSWRGGKLDASAQTHVQGPVRRRDSDRLNMTFLPLREDRVGAWATIDARLAYRVMPWAELGVRATNLLDSRAAIIKNNDYPFDYRSDGRRVMFTLDLE
jgi:outer membrane receptor protein involved in Fe transport